MLFSWKKDVKSMKTVALLVGLLVAAVGVAGIVTPDVLLWLGRRWATPLGVYVLAALQIAIGLILIGVATASRSPVNLSVLGTATVVSGVIAPLLGVERARAYIGWWSRQDPSIVRVLGVLALAFGVLIACAVYPVGRSRAATVGA